MSDQEISDRLAELAGWVAGDGVWFNAKGEWPNHGYEAHPFPVGDVNAVLAAWPKWWEWQRISGLVWEAWRGPTGREPVKTTDTGNVWHDLALLTAMVLEREARR